MASTQRLSTGVVGLDERLGGGLIPGTLTVVVGATGIGKTQLGLQFAEAGRRQENVRGVVFDMTARGDSQHHVEYARRLFHWQMVTVDAQRKPDLEQFFSTDLASGDYLHVFDYRGQRVTRRDLEFEQWQDWQAELNAKLSSTIAFLYGNLLRGCRRVVVDGIEPADRPSDSIQLHLFEYVYHQILRKDPQWVARDLFRERFRQFACEAAENQYDINQVGCLLLSTSHQTLLDDMIARGLDEGDAVSNANTLIYMGKVRRDHRYERALYIAKHRGSECSDEIVPYRIGDHGMVV